MLRKTLIALIILMSLLPVVLVGYVGFSIIQSSADPFMEKDISGDEYEKILFCVRNFGFEVSDASFIQHMGRAESRIGGIDGIEHCRSDQDLE